MIINFSNIGSGGGGSYVLPVATDSVLGGIKVGKDLTIDSAGTLDVRYYDLDQMSQQERADFVAFFLTLTEQEKEEIRVFRDHVACEYERVEGEGSSAKVAFFEYRQNGWSSPELKFRHFFVKYDGTYELLGQGTYANILEFYTTYTGHTLSQRDNLSPLEPLSQLGTLDARTAISIRMVIQNNPTYAITSSAAWAERGEWPGGYITGIWHYSGNVITATWRVWENSATLASWTEMPEITAIGNGLTVSGGTLSVSGGSAGEQFTIYNLDEMTQQELIALYNMITGTTSADTVNASNMFIKTFSEGTIGPLRLQLITNDYYGRIVFGAAFNNPYDENVVWAAEVWINGEGSIETAKVNTIRGVSKNTDYAGYFDSVSNPLVYDKGTSGFTDSEGTPIVNGQTFGGSFYWFVVVPLQGDWGQAIPLLPFKVIDENDVETMYYHPTISTKEIPDTVIDGVTYTKIFTARYADFKVSMYVNDNPKTANHTFVEI